MCTRYKLTIEEQELLATYVAEMFMDDYRPRYNIAPTQTVPVLVNREEKRRIEGFRFGLVPAWAIDSSIGNKLLNARSETVAEKPSFRGAWKHARRCAVLTDGFYEWKKPESEKGSKVPHVIEMADRRPFALAGLWERWGPGDDPLLSVTIVTTTPNDLLSSIHDRMPVVLGLAEEWDAWVDPAISSDDLTGLFRPYPAEEMHAYAVSTYVNKPGNEGPQCAEPAAPEMEQ
jgi:putative SOS response-associated peptidase YedK